MSSVLSPRRWWGALQREWMLYHLGLPEFRFMFDAPPPNEWVSLDCETTGLNVRSDEIISIGAVRIVGNRILTSERLELLVRPEKGVSADSVRIHRLREQDVAQGLPIDEAMKRLMHFIGSRPLVGYYLEFDVAMINRALFPLLGMGLPQPQVEVSSAVLRLQISPAAGLPAAGQRQYRSALCDADAGPGAYRCGMRTMRSMMR